MIIHYQICPTEKQKQKLEFQFRASRFVFNYLLHNDRKSGVFVKHKLSPRRLIDSFPRLKKAISQSLRNSIRELNSLSAIYNLNTIKHKDRNSDNYFSINRCRIKKGFIYITKFKDGIKISNYIKVIGKIRKVKIYKDKYNNYYISLSVFQKTKSIPF